MLHSHLRSKGFVIPPGACSTRSSQIVHPVCAAPQQGAGASQRRIPSASNLCKTTPPQRRCFSISVPATEDGKDRRDFTDENGDIPASVSSLDASFYHRKSKLPGALGDNPYTRGMSPAMPVWGRRDLVRQEELKQTAKQNFLDRRLQTKEAQEELFPEAQGVEQFYKNSRMDPFAPAKEVKRHVENTGDPWPSALLRLKSFEDLHKLWYILLKEKNLCMGGGNGREMGERQLMRQTRGNFENKGRIKKCKVSMKRLLTVLARREIHEQCLRSKAILEDQKRREALETRRFHLEEQQKVLDHKIKRMRNSESVAKEAWRVSYSKNALALRKIMDELVPLRKSTMQLLIPDWRYSRKYSDLPGMIRWKKQWIRALDETKRRPFKFY